MNVVGKVGSLISQSVYSVATPFHPFGGAVDVIVVKQQDGTFRSTPWYVRFGKFQGVLKGAEKTVRISVNGVEADFHMFLDNSGEAYFVREVNSSNVSETNGDLKCSDGVQDGSNKNIAEFCRLEHSVSDSGVDQLSGVTGPKRFERAESDTRFYEFQEEQSSLEDSVNLSEYGSGRYEGLDGEHFGEAQILDSEVVLVSVDGHVLTAPVSASEQNDENVQLNTPLFHIGPDEGSDFCEGNGEFSSGDNVFAADYINKVDSAAAKDSSDGVCNISYDSTVSRYHPEVCDHEECGYRTEEKQNLSNHDSEYNRQNNVEDASVHKEDIFKSCLELYELGRHGENADSEEINSSLEADISQVKHSSSNSDVDKTQSGTIGDSRNKDLLSPSHSPNHSNHNESPDFPVGCEAVEKKLLKTNYVGSNSVSVNSIDNENFDTSTKTEGQNGSPQKSSSDDKSCKNELVEIDATSCKEIRVHASSGFEISLCGNKLHPGMGLDAAAEVFEAHRISKEEYTNSATSIVTSGNLIIRFGKSYFPWEKAAHIVLGMAAFGVEIPVEPQDAIPVEQNESSNPRDDESMVTSTSSSRRWRLWPIPFRRVKTLEHNSSNASSEDLFVDTESGLQNLVVDSTPASSERIESPHKQFIRTNVPTNEQIESLHLKEGQNVITFSFSTRVLGTQQVDAHLYLWKWNAKIVISDVDGTITKSDVLGQFMPLVGRDWTQSGVARLFSAIKENGYQLLFLSARAIVQAYLTRNFLVNLKQDGKALPNGPVVISPDGLFPSLYREVIRRAPHEFKIACLEDIKRLFPSDHNPFYAGFGNRDTDELSYRKIGIPKGKIFIINPKGEVAISHCIDVRSYTSLHTLVNDMFPPTSLVEQEDYNSWNYWKVPLPDIG